MSANCINVCPCSKCNRIKPLQFHVTIDPYLFPHEYNIALIAKTQRGFAKLFREFLREYAIAVAAQVDQKAATEVHQ